MNTMIEFIAELIGLSMVIFLGFVAAAFFVQYGGM